jgi:hypothetical protein
LRQLLILVQLAQQAEIQDKSQGPPRGFGVTSRYAALLEKLVNQYVKQGGSVEGLVPLQRSLGWKPW